MKVLISHIQEEQPLAEVLVEWLEREFVDQFDAELDSDIATLSSGNAWIKAIDPLYAKNTLLIVLCSPHSLQRPWVQFKPGKLDGNRTPLLLICHSGQRRDALPVQLAECDALEVNEEGFEGRFIAMVTKKTHLPVVPTIDELLFKEQLTTALRRIEVRELMQSGQTLPRELLDEECVELLTTLARSTGGSLTAGQLVEQLKLPEALITAHMQTLLQRQLVSEMGYRNGPAAYTISQRGREFMQEVSLI